MMSRGGKVRTDELPSTLRRSPKEAQETFAKAHDSATETYGEGERAHRTAYAALKHKFEKRGDHWVPKARKGPSDPRAKQELYRRAADLDVQGRSRMSKQELAAAIARKQG
jgi:cation transport regulator ChaB